MGGSLPIQVPHRNRCGGDQKGSVDIKKIGMREPE